MTSKGIMADNCAMMYSSDEIIKNFEEERAPLKWSKHRMAQEAVVPYSWITDLYRNRPRKPDMQRVQQVLDAFEKAKSHAHDILTDKDRGFIAALDMVFSVMAPRIGIRSGDLELALNAQMKNFQLQNQSDAISVLQGWIDVLHLKPDGLPSQSSPQFPQPHLDQLNQKKDL